MKIAIVFDTMLYGGIERVGISYVQLLLQQGHSIHAYVLNESEDIILELEAICKVFKLNLKKTKCPEAYWTYIIKYPFGKLFFPIIYYTLRSVQPIIKKVYRYKSKYDIAIAFSGHYNDLTFVADNFIESKKKVAWLHGAEFEYSLLSPGYNMLYKKIKNLICLSELCDVECRKFNNDNGIVKYKLYNPIIVRKEGINEYKVAQLKKEYGDFCLMIARLAKDKDQKTAILAVKYLKEKYSKSINLLLVGDGDQRGVLEEFVQVEGLDENVIFMGACSDVQNYYSAAKIYVHASPIEGLPTALLEAMSFGLPIAATDSIPGVREILGNNNCGLISPIENPALLADNIYSIYSDDSLCEELIKRGNRRILDFAPDVIASQLEKIIKDIIRCPEVFGK